MNCFTLLELKPEMLFQGHHRRATVLKSQLAIEVNIQIMRTFSKIREFTLNYKDIITRIEKIEKLLKQTNNIKTITVIESMRLLNFCIKSYKILKKPITI